MKKEFFTQISSEKCADTTLFGSCLCKNGDFYEILEEGWLTILSYFFYSLFYIQTIRTVPLVCGWGLFQDVGDLAEVFFVGIDGTFEDGGLCDNLFAN